MAIVRIQRAGTLVRITDIASGDITTHPYSDFIVEPDGVGNIAFNKATGKGGRVYGQRVPLAEVEGVNSQGQTVAFATEDDLMTFLENELLIGTSDGSGGGVPPVPATGRVIVSGQSAAADYETASQLPGTRQGAVSFQVVFSGLDAADGVASVEYSNNGTDFEPVQGLIETVAADGSLHFNINSISHIFYRLKWVSGSNTA